jgi:hypothetical protein
MNKINSMLVALVMIMGVFAPLISADTVTTEAVLVPGTSEPIIDEMFVFDEDGNCVVTPNPGTGMDEVCTLFYKYAIVSDPNGISDIATVFEQLRDPNGNPLSTETQMTDITSEGEVITVLDDALACGMINQTEYDEYVWGLDPLKAQFKMFKIVNQLNNHNTPGDYIVYFKVVDNQGGFSEDTCTFVYESLDAMEIDFDNVNYGAIEVGVEKWVAGDIVFGTSDRPTIKNQGNVDIQIMVLGDDLTGVNSPSQTIDASALSVEFMGQHEYDISSWVTLDGVLTPCTPDQISFDINAPTGTTSNEYVGSLSIVIA